MAKIWRKIPVVGKIVEIVNRDPYKERLKNLLRRQCISGAAAVAVLSGAAAVVVSGGLAIAGEAWEDVDKAIDSLSDKDARTIYLSVGGWNLW